MTAIEISLQVWEKTTSLSSRLSIICYTHTTHENMDTTSLVYRTSALLYNTEFEFFAILWLACCCCSWIFFVFFIQHTHTRRKDNMKVYPSCLWMNSEYCRALSLILLILNTDWENYDSLKKMDLTEIKWKPHWQIETSNENCKLANLSQSELLRESSPWVPLTTCRLSLFCPPSSPVQIDRCHIQLQSPCKQI